MPARDSIHDAVVAALKNDGWQITDDPLVYRFGRRLFYVDLAAESEAGLVGLSRQDERIAVEIKSFPGPSDIVSLEHAVGQYVVYNLILEMVDPARTLYLAIPRTAYEEFFSEPVARLVIERLPLRLIVIDCIREEVVLWHPDTRTS